jgi:tripartite-type tricarboxylate transporter receptor subunit TctC
MKIFASSLVLIVSVVFLGYSPPASVAAAYPEKPITLIAPYGAGGSTDVVARTMAEAMKRQLPQPFVVINRTGGGGAIGVTEVVRAKPDGYTLGVVSNSSLVLPHIQDLAYKSSADFQPIIAVHDTPSAFTVNAKTPWKTLDEFVASAKASPGKLKVAVASLGVPYLDMALFMETTGIQFNLVTTEGDAQTIAQLLGGHVDAGFPATGALLGHVRAGTLRVLGLASDTRYSDFPDIRTFAELGYKKAFIEFYQQIFGPKGMPEPVLKLLHDSFKKALEDEVVKATFLKAGFILRYRSTADLTRQMAADDKLFGDLVKKLKLKQ